jgi:XTP/dITP diphosphohydrolase
MEILSLKDIQVTVPVVEDGMTAEANACKKARAYAGATGLPTLSIDEALYIGGLASYEQPGTNVRRYLGVEATDEALLEAFLAKIRSIAPAERTATWIFAFCLALPEGEAFSDQVELYEMFIDRPSLPILPGYPLSSVLFDVTIGKVLRDFTPEEERQRLEPVYEKVGKVVRAAGLL